MATTINSGYANSPKLTANIADHADVYGGRALVFDGVTDYLACGTGLGNQLGNGYSKDNGLTASLWFKNNGTTDGGLFQIGNNGGAGEFSFQKDNNNDLYFLLNGNGWHRKVSFTDTSSWHHVVCIYGSLEANSKIYLDGEAVGTAGGSFPSTLDFNGLHTTIGNYWNLAYRFNGKITDVKVFNTELTEAQVTELYRKPENTPSAVQDNLVAWYPMIEGNPESPQSIVYDHSEKKLGSEKITSNTASDWTDFTSDGTQPIKTTTTNGVSLKSQGDSRASYHTITGCTNGSLYKVVFNARTDLTDSNVKIYFNASTTYFTSVISTTDTQYTIYGYAGSSNALQISGLDTGTTIFIENLSVKEVLMGNHATTNFFGDDNTNGHGAFDVTTNWSVVSGSLGTQWSIGSSKATHATGNTNTLRYENSSTPTISGRQYQIDFTISGRTAGNLDFAIGGGAASESDFTASGSTILASGGSANRIIDIKPSSDFDGSVELITVKEVGISSSGFETAINEPVVPQVPLMRYNQKMLVSSDASADTYVLLPDGLTQGLTEFTFSIWHRKNVGDGSILFAVDGGGSYIRFLNATRIYAHLPAETGSFTIDASGIVDDGNLHHYVLSISASSNESKLYVDGVLKETDTNDGNYYNANIRRIGNYAGTQTPSMHDEFSIFNTALNQTQVQELFNNGVALDATTHSKSGNLLGYWRNDGVTTWLDRGGIPEATFNGSSAFIDCGGDIDEVGAFSISLWFNADTFSSSPRNFAHQGTGFFGTSYNTQGKLMYQGQGSGANNLETQTVLSTGVWHHAVLTVSGTNAGDGAIYVNGSRDDDGASTSFMNAGNFIIGKNPDASNRYFDGKMAQIAIFNRVLSASEVSTIYNLGQIGADISSYSGLKGYWFLDGSHANPDNSGSDKVLDRSGNGNHGTLTDVVLTGNNDGTVTGSPDSIIIREGLNSNRDGLGFYFKDNISGALRLDSIENVTIPDTKTLSFPSREMSLEAWIKIYDISVTGNIICKDSQSGSVREYSMLAHTTNDNIKVSLYTDASNHTAYYSPNNSILEDTWYHVVFTLSGTTGVIYINGDAVTTTTTGNNFTGFNTTESNLASNVQIGKNIAGNSNSFNGIIDEVRIYNKKLSPAEVSKNHKHGKGKHKND
jgi:hypothetical protein